MSISSLLIANRGEIAVRIIHTCRNMGIEAVAVYSEADRHAPHVALADTALLIGAAESAHSYLNSNAIIKAALDVGVDAIHPGYGFLSESEELIAACEKHGLVFVGPHREAIRLMGSKIESKRLAGEVGVASIPGYHDTAQDDRTLLAAAGDIGFPLMIKASAGGGGRGMRRIDSRDQMVNALPQARQEALAGFGNDQLLLEKLIESPRHIEVQIAADKTGAAVHLFERECSIQRNHQKIIEEAPAAFLEEPLRQRLYKDALTLAQAIEYDSLGTVEFLVDAASRAHYFLEMNTRLQVEHPVTEAITGLDLVEWQIRIAGGEPLPRTQREITAHGWAIEARINAEDPASNYQPQTGTIDLYREPDASAGPGHLRTDSGVTQGAVVSSYYDPMLAKLIAWGADRESARRSLALGLESFGLQGIGTNLAFLADIVNHENFSQKPLTTNFLPENFAAGWQAPIADNTPLVAAAIAQVLELEKSSPGRHTSPWQSLGGYRLLARADVSSHSYINLITPSGQFRTVAVTGFNGEYRVHVLTEPTCEGIDSLGEEAAKKTTTAVRARYLTADQLLLELDGKSLSVEVQWRENKLALRGLNGIFTCQIVDIQTRALDGNGDGGNGEHLVKATLPGQVVEIKTAAGKAVQRGDTLVVLDSMKLLHNLVAQTDGTVKEVFSAVGENVEGGATLIEITPAG